MKKGRCMNNMNKGWNPFLNLVIDLKRTYQEVLKKEFDYYPIDARVNKTCINRWLDELNDDKYKNMFSGLLLWQYKDYVVAHYLNYYTAINENGEEVHYKDFFKVYQGLYMECRGVMIDVKHEKLVLAPFRKFMNLEECEETLLENIKKRIEGAKTIEFTDKLDGSMISAGMYGNKLAVCGSSCNHPEKSVPVKNSIQYINEHENYMEMLSMNPERTFIFEHVFPKIDTHVVDYQNCGLYLIGIRELKDGREWPYRDVLKMAEKFQIPATTIFPKTLDAVLEELDQKEANEAEGFVLNIDGFKVKIKYNDYISVNRLIYGLVTPNGVIRAIEDNTFDDCVSKMPQVYKEKAITYRKEVIEMIQRIDKKTDDYLKMVPGGTKKEDMIWIVEHVPKQIRSFVVHKYKKQQCSYLKADTGHYRTYAELQRLLI